MNPSQRSLATGVAIGAGTALLLKQVYDYLGKRRPKVLVSGCFDLLHSGHVEFFKQASKYGDLYVRLGADENIKMLKNHDTMYCNEERVFMVKNIGCVYDAAISKGKGRYDFETDMKEIKPDLYVVNEDGSGMEKRQEIAKKHGVKIVVLPRTPSEGLEVRSSTSMKARLRDMVLKAEREKEAKDMAIGVPAFHKVFPWRLCFAGGWMDLKWCNHYYPGCAITINIKFNEKICRDYCGLATSSRKVAIRLWNGKFPSHLESLDAAKLLWGAENFDCYGSEKRHYSAGSQDHCGLMFPGVNKLCYKGGCHWPYKIVNMSDPNDSKQAAIFKWLEDVLYIVDIPFVSRPKGYNSQKINLLKDEKVSDAEKVNLVKALGEASEEAWKGIQEMDADKLGGALSNTMKAWKAMLPYTVDPFTNGDAEKSKKLLDFWKKYDYPNTKGCLFSGAGGGFLMVINDKPVENGIKITINTDNFCKPVKSGEIEAM
uniref:Cytidyltransferase-like domain-containing protein n=1 Tax=Lotharella globosa TaxID=91324 RepID=A0A6U2XYV3_9EUKA|mmetsp:Transcript_2465/g.4810  ORF Transcript_2465/g.4810 Transcript_2465/m.4810 type:complete len:485 (+) Transcript_2465:102-1556(+)